MSTTGILHDAKGYDFFIGLMMFGRERVFRENALRLAALAPGETVLDVGCGTGTLAVVAKKHVGPSGSVYGIDASAEMIGRARMKANKNGAAVIFEKAAAQELPFPDASMDAVLSTIMLHHLPRKARLEALIEIRRVLKPGGRVVIVDFQESGNRHNFFEHFRKHRHGHVKIEDMLALVKEAGFQVRESAPFGKRNLYFVRATPQGA